MRPIVIHLQVFGDVCYVFVLGHFRSNLTRRPSNVSSWDMISKEKDWCYNLNTSKCYVLGNVVFGESSSWWECELVPLLDEIRFEDQMQEKQGEYSQPSAQGRHP